MTTTKCPECDQFPARLGEICRGEAIVDGQLMNPEHVTIWRERRGLPPIGVTAEEWDVSQKCRGAGDVVAKFTHYTGIAWVVNAVSTATGIPCGCGSKQNALNKAVPFKKRS